MVSRSEIESIVAQKTAAVSKDAYLGSSPMSMIIGKDLKLSSLKTIELTMLLEDAFDIKIPLAMVLESTTLGAYADLVENLLRHRAASQTIA